MKTLKDLSIIILICLCAVTSAKDVARLQARRASYARISLRLSRRENIE